MDKLTPTLLLSLSLAANAQARTEQMRWTHPSPDDVTRFSFSWGTSPGDRPNLVSDGKPTPDSSGVFHFDIPGLPDTGALYFAAQAEGPGGVSPWSNEIVRLAQASLPTISSFRLWDTSSQTVRSEDFQGGTIPEGCFSLEAITDLPPMDAPGSILFSLDGASICENNGPFASGADDSGVFRCHAGLSSPGPHTLTATPFDGHDCSGNAGPARVVSFQGGEPAPPPPPPVLLGAPGLPYLVRELASEPPATTHTCSRRLVKLVWGPATGASSYQVTMTDKLGAKRTFSLPNVTEAKLSLPPASNPLTFTVEALDSQGNIGPVSPTSQPNWAACDAWDSSCNGKVNTGDSPPTAARYCDIRGTL